MRRTPATGRGTLQAWETNRIPYFGDVVGLRRLYRAAVANIRQMDIPEAQKLAWIRELTRRYRAAVGEGATRS